MLISYRTFFCSDEHDVTFSSLALLTWFKETVTHSV